MARTVVLFALGVLVVISIARKAHQYWILRAFGGHWTAGWTRMWLLRTQSSGNMNKIYTSINDQYGSTARIAPHFLITTDPDLIKRMSAVRSTWVRSEWYAALRLHPSRDNIASITDEAWHADVRSKMTPGYSGKDNAHIEGDVDDRLFHLIDLINKSYISTSDTYQPVDLSRIISYFTLDVISQVAFGHEFGFLQRDEDHFGYISNLKTFLPAILIFGAYIECQRLFRMRIMRAVLPKSTDKRGLGKVMGFARDRVRERFGDKPVVRRDMLGSFIKRGMTQEQLESETLTQITAGSDSTASALRMTLHYICTTPPVQARLLSEVRAAIAEGRVSRPVIRDAEARRLPYLQACIKECLRLYPPVTGLLAKQVPPGGALIDGKFAPAGTWIGQNPWGMQRNRDIYGADVEVFRPERWFPIDGSVGERSRVERMTDTVGLVFGYGRFGCLGRGVAMMELNKALVELLLRFNFQPCSLSKPFDEVCVGFYLHDNMMFCVTEREQHETGESDGSGMVQQFGEVSALPGAPEE